MFDKALGHIDKAAYTELAAAWKGQGMDAEEVTLKLAALAEAGIPWDVLLPGLAGRIIESKDDWLIAFIIRPIVRKVFDPEWRSELAGFTIERWRSWRVNVSKRKFALVEDDGVVYIVKNKAGVRRELTDETLLESCGGHLGKVWRKCIGEIDDDDEDDEDDDGA